jgi:hypothetical protein
LPVTDLTSAKVERRRSRPRSAVSEIRLDSNRAKLLVRVSGVAIVEFYLGPNPALNAFVATTLNDALQSPVIGAAAAPDHSSETSFDHPVDAPTKPASKRYRRLLLSLAAVLVLAGAVMMFLPFPWPVIGIYVLLGSVAPVGIALGTQDKEFYE